MSVSGANAGFGGNAAAMAAGSHTSRGHHPSAPIPVQGPGVATGVRERLGETGLEIFPLILGGSEFGWNVDLESSHDILDAYAELGGNAVHTADSFSGGRSEHIIGQWMHSRGLRDDMVLAVRIGGHPDNPGLGPVDLVRAVESSLGRLRTDRIDLIYLDATADSAVDAAAAAVSTRAAADAFSIGAGLVGRARTRGTRGRRIRKSWRRRPRAGRPPTRPRSLAASATCCRCR